MQAVADQIPADAPAPPKRNDFQKIERMAALIYAAHDGMMIDKIDKQIKSAHRLQQFAATGDVADLKAPENKSPESEDTVGVNLGNEKYEYHIHNYPTPAAAPAPPVATAPIPATPETPATDTTNTALPSTAPATPSAKSGLGWLPLAAIGAALLAGGGGAGYIVNNVINHAAPAVTAADSAWQLQSKVLDHP